MRSSWREEWFQQQLDAAVNHRPIMLSGSQPQEWQDELHLAQQLAALDMSTESTIRTQLRSRLLRRAQSRRQGWPRQGLAVLPRPRLAPQTRYDRIGAWVAAAALVLLVLLNQPVLAAVQRIFGYGYLPETGFIRLYGTLLLKGPVVQQRDGQSVTVRQGVVAAERTELWIEGDDLPGSPQNAWLELPGGQRLPALSWLPQAGKLTFDMLPQGVRQSTLELPDGWRIPLEWIESEQAGLAPTVVSVPYPQTTPTGEAPSFTAGDRVQVCARAAFVNAEGTHVLLEGEAVQPGAELLWDVTLRRYPVTLSDEHNRAYALRGQEVVASSTGASGASLTLQFSPVPSDVQIVRLRLPALVVRLAGPAAGTPTTLVGPFELVFRLPDLQPMPCPTPKVLGNRAFPSPAPTPTTYREATTPPVSAGRQQDTPNQQPEATRRYLAAGQSITSAG